MKKIFSKITKERIHAFQIETSIYVDEQKNRFVGKKAIYPEGQPHIDKMAAHYAQNQAFYAPCEKRGTEVIFPFITGETYYDRLLEKIQKKDKQGVQRILTEYKNLIGQLYPDTVPFKETNEFAEIFGSIPGTKNYASATGVNMDLTLDNIILHQGQPVVIDYEWIFDFSMPVLFPVYRALFALWAKHGNQLSTLMTEEELYHLFDLSEQDKKVMKAMSDRVVSYVEGGSTSYHNVLKKYEKKAKTVAGDFSQNHFVQVFYNDGKGYSEEHSQVTYYPNGNKVTVMVGRDILENCTELRIDPAECASMVRINRMEADNGAYIRKITPNEMRINGILFEKEILFVQDDPQMSFRIPKEENWIGLEMEFELMLDDSATIKNVSYLLNHTEDHGELEALVASREAQLCDKLRYIEGTTVYKTLLKKKVDSLGLWGDL